MRMGLGLGFGRRGIGTGGGGDTTAPVITNVVPGPPITMEVDEVSTLWMLRNSSATLLAGSVIKAGAEDSWPVSIGENPVLIDDSLWAAGPHKLHFAAEDGSGNITATGSLVEYVKGGAGYTHVLNPAAASSGLRYSFTANTIFNIATAKAAGYWLGGYAYYDGTAWTGTILSACNSASTTSYMFLDGNKVGWRAEGGSEANSVALGNPGSVGWYFVTGHLIIKEAGDASPRRVFNFWRNGTLATPFSNATAAEGGLIALNRFGFGHLADSTPSNYNDFEYCGLCWGTGDPALMHAWVYNSGTLRDVRDYNFAGDANGCTFDGFWTAAQDGAPAFDVTDVALDDSVGALDAPTLVGTMQWTAQTAPIGA